MNADGGVVSTSKACQLAGVTFRQADFWCRTGRLDITRPSSGPGRGKYREWSRDDVRALALLRALHVDGHLALARAAEVVRAVRPVPQGGWLAASLTEGGKVTVAPVAPVELGGLAAADAPLLLVHLGVALPAWGRPERVVA